MVMGVIRDYFCFLVASSATLPDRRGKYSQPRKSGGQPWASQTAKASTLQINLSWAHWSQKA